MTIIIAIRIVYRLTLLISIFCFTLRPDHLNGHIKQVHTTERPHKCQVKRNCYWVMKICFKFSFVEYFFCWVFFFISDMQCLFCYKRSPPLTPRVPRGQNPLQSVWQVSPSCLHDRPPEETHWRNSQLLWHLQQRLVSCCSTVTTQAHIRKSIQLALKALVLRGTKHAITCWLGHLKHLDNFSLGFWIDDVHTNVVLINLMQCFHFCSI